MNNEMVLKRMEELGVTVEDLKALVALLDDPSEAKRVNRADLEKEVKNELRRLGGPCHIKGYQYVVDAIMLVVDNKNLVNAITKELYPQVAKMHDTTQSRVERAIRHYIEVVWDRGSVEVIEEKFGSSVSPLKGKPTNSEFIALMADDFRMTISE